MRVRETEIKQNLVTYENLALSLNPRLRLGVGGFLSVANEKPDPDWTVAGFCFEMVHLPAHVEKTPHNES